MFFFRKKYRFNHIDLYKIISLEEAKEIDLGKFAIALTNEIKLKFSKSDLQYSLNYDRQRFKNKSKLENLDSFSKLPEIVELAGYTDQVLFSCSNCLLNQIEPGESGLISIDISIHYTIWDETKVQDLIKSLDDKFQFEYAHCYYHNSKNIEWERKKTNC